MSVRIIKQKQEHPMKLSVNGESVPTAPVLIESTLLLLPNRPQTPIVSFEHVQQPTNLSTITNECIPFRVMSTLEHSSIVPSTSIVYPRSAIHRVHVPVHNASQWFNGPDMKNDRTGRMEQVVTSLVRRSFRPSFTYGYETNSY